MPVRGLGRNAIWSAAEVVVNGIGLFFIYRNVVQTLGVSMVGVWSIVLATTAFGRLADTGVAPGMARFIARALAEGRPERAVLYMRTGSTAIAVFMAVVAALFYLPFWFALELALNGVELAMARSLLPWALMSFWLIQLKAVYDAALLSVHRADLRAVSNVVGMVFQILASIALVKTHGLNGLAWAQFGQFAISLVVSLGFLATIARISPQARTSRWFSTALLKELLGFGSKIQIGIIANLMFEPACKIVLGAVAGTTILGVFEMAHRMVYQARSVAFMALQVTVPAFADLGTREPEQVQILFAKVCKMGALAGGGLMASVVLLSPLVSWLWLGELNWMFVYIAALVAIGWTFHILISPAIFLGMADGRVLPNSFGQVISGIIAPMSVYVLGAAVGPLAAILGVALGRIPGDALPGLLTRPAGGWRRSAVANPYSIAAFACVTACSAIMIAMARARL